MSTPNHPAREATETPLKPCPFCGSAPNSILRQSNDEFGECEYAYHEIECMNQKCEMRPLVNENLQADDGDNAWSAAFERAEKAWNTRADSQLERENVALLSELQNFVNAKRYNREHFEDDTSFVDWVLSRSRAAIKSATEGSSPRKTPARPPSRQA